MKTYYSCLVAFFISFSVMAQDSSLRPESFLTTGSARRAGTDCFQLTSNQLWQGGTVWYKDPISLAEPFEMEMDLFFGCNDREGADGMVFIFHPRLRDGFQGEGIGFGGLSPAFGIEMDTYENPHLEDPHYDHVALMKNGRMHHAFGITKAVPLLPNLRNIEDCKNHRVKITWLPSSNNLKIAVDGSIRINMNYDIIEKVFNGRPIVHWGISAATGGESNQHKICMEKLEFTTPTSFDKKTKDQLLTGETYTLKKVEFLSGKTDLQALSFEELDKLASFLRDNPRLHVFLSGHTDSVGSASKNKAISKKRAEEVARYLMQKGIPKKRIHANGHGEESPKTDNTTPEGRKQNRRIDVNLLVPRV